jgi:hypothetical protein
VRLSVGGLSLFHFPGWCVTEARVPDDESFTGCSNPRVWSYKAGVCKAEFGPSFGDRRVPAAPFLRR